MPESDNLAKASPTKSFFISILVRDIYLNDAIIELVDNSIDAARSKFVGLEKPRIVIDLTFDKDKFQIHDNSGGITIEAARERAFRFGRAEDAPATPGSVGEFGVGMKRALFKIGRFFTVESKTESSKFLIEVDVEKWEKDSDDDPNNWTFSFKTVESGLQPANEIGTAVTVKKLYPYASESFASTAFEARLISQIREAHAERLGDNMQVVVNKKNVSAQPSMLLQSDLVKPKKVTHTLEVNGGAVIVTLTAGLGEAKLSDAGWYILCNGRLIERAEKTSKTGWDTDIEGESVPKPHWQYRRFRGFVEFASNDQNTLPWNTTKTGLDVEAAAYRQIKPEIVSTMREIITFLNELDGENQTGGALTDAITAARPTPLSVLSANENFTVSATSAVPAAPRQKKSRIAFDKPSEEVELAKGQIGASSNRDLGEKIFDYFMDGEGLNG